MAEKETKTEAKKTAAKKAEPAAVESATGESVKAAAASKKKSTKTATKTTAKKTAAPKETRATVYIQYDEKEIEPKAVLDQAKAVWYEEGHSEAELQSIDLYIKPQENAAYFVINGTDSGCIQL